MISVKADAGFWRADSKKYQGWVGGLIKDRPERSHGFRYLGQYQEQVPSLLKLAERE